MNKLSDLVPIYEGKVKKIFAFPGNDSYVIQFFSDNITIFNNPEKHNFAEKGKVTCQISSIIMDFLSRNGIDTHFVKTYGESSQIAHKLTILPIEVTVRNYAFGGLLKRSEFTKGEKLDHPLIEFMYKKDELGDPLIPEDFVKYYLLKGDEKLFAEIKMVTKKINKLLTDFFALSNIILADFKIEFGLDKNNKLLLADEISPDTCRLLDKSTMKSLDKDILRNGLGNIMDGYKEILARITEGSDLIK